VSSPAVKPFWLEFRILRRLCPPAGSQGGRWSAPIFVHPSCRRESSSGGRAL